MTETPEPVPGGEPDTTTLQRARQVWKIWSWGRRIVNAPDWAQWLWGLFQTKAGVAAVTGGIGAVAVGAVAVVAPEVFTPTPPSSAPPVIERLVTADPTPPAPIEAMPPPLPEPAPRPAAEVAPERLASDSRVFTIEGIDQDGRRASFEMIVLSRAVAWARGSTTELARAGEPLSEAQVADEVFGPDVKDRLALTSELIAAGAASAEGDVDTETERAEKRARTTAGWLSAAAPGKTVWTLNLGQYQTSCESAAAASDTGWQRPLIVFGVRSKDAGVRLDQALSNAMTGKANLPSPSCYSSFELEPHR